MRRPPRGGARVLVLLPLLLLLLGLVPVGGAHSMASGARPSPMHPAVGLPRSSTPPPGPFDWATFHGDSNRSGFTSVRGPSGPTEAWSPPQATPLPIRAGPVVNSTRIYAADIVGNVVALNRVNGSVAWRTTVWSAPTTPTLAGGRLFLGCDNGLLYALNAANGALLWTTNLSSAILQGTLDVSGEVIAGTDGGKLFALNDTTGHLLWSRTIGSPIAGAPAESGGVLYAAGSSGQLLAVNLTGAPVWSEKLRNVSLDVGFAIGRSRLFLAETNGNVTALSAANGSTLWNFSTAGSPLEGAIQATPATDGYSVDWIDGGGGIYSVYASNGTLRWLSNASQVSAGYPLLSAPVLTPTGFYVIDGSETLDDLNPVNGALRWSFPYGGLTVYSSPAVIANGLVIGTDDGVVDYFSPPSSLASWPISGQTVDPNGTPLANVTVELNSRSTLTSPDGSFLLYAANGSYVLLAGGAGTEPLSVPLTVTGPISGLRLVLLPLATFLLSGRLIDHDSGRAVPGASIVLVGPGGYQAGTLSSSDGNFSVRAPNGTDYLSVGGLATYFGLSEHIVVNGSPLSGLRVELTPVGLAAPGFFDAYAPYLLLAGLGMGALVAWLAEVSRRRRLVGLSGRILSRFGRYVLMRASLMPVQLLALLALLFAFGSFLPSVAAKAFTGVGSWKLLQDFFEGFLAFAWSMVSGDWGYAAYGHLSEPVTTYIAWWLPYTLELMAFALVISAALGYAAGLRAGWKPDGPFDVGTRLASLLGLLVPSFLVILLVLGGTYSYFVHAVGDTPYGITPNLAWYDTHGGLPPNWVGIGGNTLPTGFPLVDAALHTDGSFFAVVLAKTLFQATLIAIVYVAIFLRYARHSAAEHARALSVVAARSRGVPEGRLLWYHTGRRALPEFVLLFAITLPVYIGTQAVAEALFSDPGVGNVLLTEMTQVASSGFGITHGQGFVAGNLYQVTILFLFLVVLGGNLLADIIARYLDPRLLPEGR
ncbi:MAG: PQQ-binding-like beta-propeller repeat protein [Thermoplasmata archaeon]|nr:PQQ-binding-like beta-propeller repeat protein [Thermoplasmata archaeon]